MSRETPNKTPALPTASRPPDYRHFLHLFVEERKQRLIRYATRLLADASQAGDVYTEVFFRVLRHAEEDKIQSYHPPSLQSWLFRITRNCCYDINRSWQSRREHELHDAIPGKSNLEREVELDDAVGAILDAIGDLPADYQLPILLCKVERLKAADAAEVIGISVPALKSRLYRGLKLLKLWLTREDGGVSYFRRRRFEAAKPETLADNQPQNPTVPTDKLSVEALPVKKETTRVRVPKFALTKKNGVRLDSPDWFHQERTPYSSIRKLAFAVAGRHACSPIYVQKFLWYAFNEQRISETNLVLVEDVVREKLTEQKVSKKDQRAVIANLRSACTPKKK